MKKILLLTLVVCLSLTLGALTPVDSREHQAGRIHDRHLQG